MEQHSRGDIYSRLLIPLTSGGVAGTTADVALFPIDTIKTRLQSKAGFMAAGGFRNIYAGILPAFAGSAPSAATFFLTYESVKHILGGSSLPAPVLHMLAASVGETVSCIVRVPFEVTKQRAQANKSLQPLDIVRQTLRQEGPRGLYRGYLSTVSREIPFSFIQYPTWEFLKRRWSLHQDRPVEPWQGAVCGAIAGGIGAAITTPLDVCKTRIMLAEADSREVRLSVWRLLITISQEEGLRGLFAGFIPRVSWISIGGFVFLGAYEKSSKVFKSLTGIE